jgi:hypothetical protein
MKLTTLFTLVEPIFGAAKSLADRERITTGINLDVDTVMLMACKSGSDPDEVNTAAYMSLAMSCSVSCSTKHSSLLRV